MTLRVRPPAKHAFSREARALWRDVDGAVKMALDAHPEYLSQRATDDLKTVRNSIVKRVVGRLIGSRKGRTTRD